MQDEAYAMLPIIKNKMIIISDVLGFKLENESTNIKSIESIVSKIDNTGVNFNDVLRFTFTTDVKSYTEKSLLLLKEIHKEGMYIKRFRNAWKENKTTYLGINLDIQYGNYIFELQIHTFDSFKFRNGDDHKRYKMITQGDLKLEEVFKLNMESLKEYSTINHPINVNKITLTEIKITNNGESV